MKKGAVYIKPFYILTALDFSLLLEQSNIDKKRDHFVVKFCKYSNSVIRICLLFYALLLGKLKVLNCGRLC